MVTLGVGFFSSMLLYSRQTIQDDGDECVYSSDMGMTWRHTGTACESDKEILPLRWLLMRGHQDRGKANGHKYSNMMDIRGNKSPAHYVP